jgi:hypothetical protein
LLGVAAVARRILRIVMARTRNNLLPLAFVFGGLLSLGIAIPSQAQLPEKTDYHPPELNKLMVPPPPPEEKEWVRTIFPDPNRLFHILLADPRSTRSLLRWYQHESFNLADVALGNSWGQTRWERAQDPESNWRFQWNIEGMAYSRFHLKGAVNEFETVDFFVNLPLEMRRGPFSAKVVLFHESSHLGDDYIRRTGSTGFRYSIEGFQAFASYDVHPLVRVYGGALAMIRAIPSQQAGEFQAGFELRSRRRPWIPVKDHDSWYYLAQDVQSKGRAAWNISSNTEIGIRFGMDRLFSSARVFGSYYGGKSEFGQFFFFNESFFSCGISFDF